MKQEHWFSYVVDLPACILVLIYDNSRLDPFDACSFKFLAQHSNLACLLGKIIFICILWRVISLFGKDVS